MKINLPQVINKRKSNVLATFNQVSEKWKHKGFSIWDNIPFFSLLKKLFKLLLKIKRNLVNDFKKFDYEKYDFVQQFKIEKNIFHPNYVDKSGIKNVQKLLWNVISVIVNIGIFFTNIPLKIIDNILIFHW